LDQLLPLRQRRLGHVEAARIIQEAAAALAEAMAYAGRGLPPTPTAPPLNPGQSAPAYPHRDRESLSQN